MEIERKFVIDIARLDFDAFKLLDVRHFTQTYLTVGSDGSETRIRKSVSMINHKIDYLYTEKSDGSLVREEHNKIIDQSTYESLLKGEVVGVPIEKDRHTWLIDGFTIELDIYHKDLEGLVIAEIEFADNAGLSLEAIRTITLPAKLSTAIIKEVTDDARYKNKNLAQYGHPMAQ